MWRRGEDDLQLTNVVVTTVAGDDDYQALPSKNIFTFQKIFLLSLVRVREDDGCGSVRGGQRQVPGLTLSTNLKLSTRRRPYSTGFLRVPLREGLLMELARTPPTVSGSPRASSWAASRGARWRGTRRRGSRTPERTRGKMKRKKVQVITVK